MTYSLGIWAIGSTPGGTLYRWEADSETNGSGHVVFDASKQMIRPSDDAGNVLGDLVIDAGSGDMHGGADGVNRVQFLKVSGAILRAYARSGDVPQTAHAYFA